MNVYYYEEVKFTKGDGSEWGMDESGKMRALTESTESLINPLFEVRRSI